MPPPRTSRIPDRERRDLQAILHMLYARDLLLREQVVAVCDILGIPESPALDGVAFAAPETCPKPRRFGQSFRVGASEGSSER